MRPRRAPQAATFATSSNSLFASADGAKQKVLKELTEGSQPFNPARAVALPPLSMTEARCAFGLMFLPLS
jgi:hypothetical protein